MKSIQLYNRAREVVGIVKVDDQDYVLVNSYTWHLNNRGYVATRVNGKYHLLHRFLLQPGPHELVDHINRNKLDNQKSNLRLCNSSQNNHNYSRPKNNTSGFKGVHWHKTNKRWTAKITIEGKNKHLGYFKDKVEAAKAYDKAALELFGKFASLNL